MGERGHRDADRELDLIGLIRAAIELGNERGACNVEDPEMAAVLAYRAIEGTSHQMARGHAPIERDRVVTALQQFMRGAFNAPEG